MAWIPLANASREGGLAAAIAAGLGVANVEPDHVAEAVADAFGTSPRSSSSTVPRTSCHDLALLDELVDRAGSLRVIVTSRVVLDRVAFESVPVDTLAVPPADADLEQVVASPAFALLVDRAARAGVDLPVALQPPRPSSGSPPGSMACRWRSSSRRRSSATCPPTA